MIANPVIKKSGGSRVYSITDTRSRGFPTSAEAGEIVLGEPFGIVAENPPTVKDSNGMTVPHADRTFNKVLYGYFIMPASDVTIS